MKIVKSTSVHRTEYLEAAFASNFVDMPAISLTESGDFFTSIDRDFLLAGLTGVANDSSFAVGVSGEGGNFIAQGISVSDDNFESKLRDALGGYPGIKEIAFSAHDIGSVCYLVTILWDREIAHRIRDALGATYQSKGFNFVLDVRSRENFYGSGLSKVALNRYLELRKQIDPSAIELRYDVAELPDLLGLRSEQAVSSAAEAAFGRNGGVASAIYVRRGFGPHLSRAAISAMTRGDDRTRHKSIKTLTPIQSLDPITANSTQKWHEAKKAVQDHAYSLGSDVFEIVDSINVAICNRDELIRRHDPEAPEFNARGLASVMRELVVNSFCHGYWRVTEHGRNDNDHNEANRLAIVHANNRMEFINNLRPAGYFHCEPGFETTSRRSTLHDAFRDIGFAKGRSLGLKLIRKRLSGLGYSAPIFVKQRDIFRAIIPLSQQIEEWGFPAPGCQVSQEEVGQLYALHLSLLLREVDQDIVASALYVRSVEAAKILEGLGKKGALSKSMPDNAAHRGGYSKYLIPTYHLTDETIARKVIDDVSKRMEFTHGPKSLSIGALYQLSVRSTAHLVIRDLEQYLFKVFAGEMLDMVEAQRLAIIQMEILKSKNVLRYPDS